MRPGILPEHGFKHKGNHYASLPWFGTKIAQKYAIKGSKYSGFHVLYFRATSGHNVWYMRSVVSNEMSRFRLPSSGRRRLLGQRVRRHEFQARAPKRNATKYRADDLCTNLECAYFCWMLDEVHYFFGRSLPFLILSIILFSHCLFLVVPVHPVWMTILITSSTSPASFTISYQDRSRMLHYSVFYSMVLSIFSVHRKR